MSVREAWHVLMIRKTLMTDGGVSFDFGVNFNLKTPMLQDSIASLLYVELVTLLDEAFEERMPAADYRRAGRVKNRIEMLGKAGDLIAPDQLLAVNRRRNEIGHELEKGATVAELNAAVEIVRAQLLAWSLIADRKYELRAERSAARDSNEPGVAFEQDTTLEVVAGGKVYANLSQTTRFHNP